MGNIRGSILMILAMAGFAMEDMFVKAASRTLPVGEILIVFGLGGTLVLTVLAYIRNEAIWSHKITSKILMIRASCEILGRMFFTLALALAPLSSVSAILQATPLVVVLGAAVFFKESVGLQRWLAILIGFCGVLMILRPGMGDFKFEVVFAVLGTLGFAGRDLATRAAPPIFSNIQLNIYGLFILIPTGVILAPFTGGIVLPDSTSTLYLFCIIFFGVLAYYALTVAMRTGEVSIVTPFRYTRLLFALIISVLIFSERPDNITLIGIVLIVLSGLFSLMRNKKAPSAIPLPAG
ncbi:MAG: drug/metabolite transporter (DMT)-like permease [Desulforhopalus sp.]